MYEKVLLAVDGSESSKVAACVVNDMVGNGMIKQLVILYVIVDYAWESMKLPTIAQRDVEVLQHAKESAAQEIIKIVREFITGNVEIIEKALKGNPAAVICEEAKNIDCDMIVMGNAGKGTWGKLLLGSVSNRVVQLADCTVLIVK